MKRFMLMHIGFENPTPEIMAAWGKWFERVTPPDHRERWAEARPRNQSERDGGPGDGSRCSDGLHHRIGG